MPLAAATLDGMCRVGHGVRGLVVRQFNARRRFAHVDEIPVQSDWPFVGRLHQNQCPH